MRQAPTHGIEVQQHAYRRGLVQGLTMAEVGLLIIFVLLLLIAMGEVVRARQAGEIDGTRPVKVERLRELETAELIARETREALGVPPDTPVDDIQRLIRAIQEIADSPAGASALTETTGALSEARAARDALRVLVQAQGRDSVAVVRAVETQAFRIARQDGQLALYEQRLRAFGEGKGERPCWVLPNGTIEFLYDVVLQSDGIRMRERPYPSRARERELLPMPNIDPAEVLTPAEFLRRTRPLYDHGNAENCRFFVVVYDATAPSEKILYKSLLRTVEGHFYKQLSNGIAPF